MEAFIPLLIGAFLPPLVKLFEKKLGLKPNNSLLIIASAIGVFYAVYMTFIPEVAKEQIAMFATSAIGTAVLVYEHIIKRIQE